MKCQKEHLWCLWATLQGLLIARKDSSYLKMNPKSFLCKSWLLLGLVRLIEPVCSKSTSILSLARSSFWMKAKNFTWFVKLSPKEARRHCWCGRRSRFTISCKFRWNCGWPKCPVKKLEQSHWWEAEIRLTRLRTKDNKMIWWWTHLRVRARSTSEHLL